MLVIDFEPQSNIIIWCSNALVMPTAREGWGIVETEGSILRGNRTPRAIGQRPADGELSRILCRHRRLLRDVPMP